MPSHNDFAAMIAEMTFPADRPSFHFLNLGETHYPYMLSREEAPVLHGVHGVFKHLDDLVGGGEGDQTDRFFDRQRMEALRAQQVKAARHVDELMGELFAKLPRDTHVIVTADHGELFGEEGYFGHGPVCHPKVFEVPFVEGRVA